MELYEAALEMEKRTRDHFKRLARELPAGLEEGLYEELAAEEEEHVAMLETVDQWDEEDGGRQYAWVAPLP